MPCPFPQYRSWARLESKTSTWHLDGCFCQYSIFNANGIYSPPRVDCACCSSLDCLEPFLLSRCLLTAEARVESRTALIHAHCDPDDNHYTCFPASNVHTQHPPRWLDDLHSSGSMLRIWISSRESPWRSGSNINLQVQWMKR